ncbi:MAG TPA: hypothetical protein PKI60_03275 [Oscillospiraceae bacterium]|nr:hypothetical protein [Oscillospiraceae bacterium]
MAETKCPLCGKSLINGRCDDCGYYDDNVKLENESSDFYTKDYGYSEQSSMNDDVIKEEQTFYEDGVEKKVTSVFESLLTNGNEQSGMNGDAVKDVQTYYVDGKKVTVVLDHTNEKQNIKSQQDIIRVVFIILSLLIPVVGFVIGISLLQKPEEEMRKLGKLLIIIGVVRLILQMAFAFL